jgi:hypothetical protein
MRATGWGVEHSGHKSGMEFLHGVGCYFC